MSGFLQDLTRPRLSALLLALVTVLAFFSWLDRTTSARFEVVSTLGDVAFTSKVDDCTRAQVNALAAGDSSIPTVLAVGGSGLREAIVPAPEFEELLLNAGHPAARFLNLSTSSQTFSESYALMNAVPLRAGAVILFHLTYARFRESRADTSALAAAPRMPFISQAPVLAAVGETERLIHEVSLFATAAWLRGAAYHSVVKERYGNGSFLAMLREIDGETCGFGFGCVALVVGGRTVEPAPMTYAYAGKQPSERRKQSRARRAVMAHRGKIFENASFNAEFLALIARWCAERGHRLVLLDLPKSRVMRPIYAEVHEPLSAAIDAARSAGASYLDLDEKLQLEEADFHDHEHVLESGRVKVSTALAHELVTLRSR